MQELQNKYLNSWAIGSVGGGASEAFLSMFLLYFYNQVLGLDPFLCGLGIALSLFVDAFTDPMIGGISDRTTSRFGRRIPYMALGLFGFALGIFLLFNARLGSTQFALFFQLLLFIIITRISSTMFFIPRASLGIEMIKGYEQRNLLHARDNNFGILGTVIFYSAIAIIFGNNWNQESGYQAVSIIVISLFLITSLYSVFRLRNIESYFEKTSIDDATKETGVIKGLLLLWKNDSWRNLIIGTSLFVPGMFYYVNPSLAGLGSVEDAASLAYKMNLGGYHLIQKVRTSFSPGKFETVVMGTQTAQGRR